MATKSTTRTWTMDGQGFLGFLRALLVQAPLALVLGLLTGLGRAARLAAGPVLATCILWYASPALGQGMAVLSCLYLAGRYYGWLEAKLPRPCGPEAALDAQRHALEGQARAIHGDARFLPPAEALAKGLVKAGTGDGVAAPFLGKVALAQEGGTAEGFVHYPGRAHLLTFAATGTGKGRGTVIPNLLDYDGSVLVIDPKGENAAVTARRRRALQEVAVLDPWGVSGIETSSFNPLSWVTPDNPDHVADAVSLAEAIVVPDNGRDSHWNESAADLVAGLLVHIALSEKPEDRHLLTLRKMLCLPHDLLRRLFKAMALGDHGGIVENTGNRFAGMPEKEFGSVLSTAQRHTQFLDTAPGPMRRVLVDTSFDLRALKSDKGLSLYLCLPPSRLKSHSRWLRIMVNMAIASLEHSRKQPAKPVLFMLDEAAVLGHMKKVAESVALMRGYGMQLWTIWQDLPQLKAAYKDEWGTFISQSGAMQMFGVNDQETADYFSRFAGEHGVVKAAASAGAGASYAAQGGMSESAGASLSIEAKRLLKPQDILRLGPDEVLCFVQGELPISCRKVRYDRETRFRGMFDGNPYL